MILKPGSNIARRDFTKKSIFLAGPLTKWRDDIGEFFSSRGYTVFDPSSDAPNPTWELDALEAADRILFYFPSGSIAAVSMFEFGAYLQSQKIFIVCEEDYQHRGHVEAICSRFDVPLMDDMAEVRLGSWV